MLDESVAPSETVVAADETPVAAAVSSTGTHPDVAPVTRLILEGALARTILRLGAPNMLAMIVYASVSIYDAYVVSRLGGEALAGVSLVFPIFMMLRTMANGAVGGAIASAIARALGGGRKAEADALVVHALLLSVAMGLGFAVVLVGAGRAIYTLMGGTGESFVAALTYSNILFGGAPAIWLMTGLAGILRGAGDMGFQSKVLIAGDVLHMVTAPLLVFGIGGVPGLGIAGLAASTVGWSVIQCAVFTRHLAGGRTLVRPRLHELGIRSQTFASILRVAAPATAYSLVSNVNVILLTALVARFGTAALAGYGIGTRLEYLQIPLAFGLGTALVTVVATNLGAGRTRRAVRAAWVGAAMAGGVCGTCGLLGALFPRAWAGLFTSASQISDISASYLLTAGPAYVFLGVGLALYLASQGVGRVAWPVAGSVVRLTVAAGGGWLAITIFEGGIGALFAAIAISLVVFGLFVALGFRYSVTSRIV